MIQLAGIAFALLVQGTPSRRPPETTTPKAGAVKLRIQVNDTVVSATLNSTKTASGFASLLPLGLPMNDLFRREKYGHLPKALSEDARHTHRYEVGDIAYWSPSQDVAIFYRHDGEKIPAPGLIVIGKLDAGAEAFQVAGAVTVTIERAE